MKRRSSPEERRATAHYARAVAAGSDTDYKAADWRFVRVWLGNCCLACGTTEQLTVDHVVPLARGGSNTLRNLQSLCKRCNDRKGTRTIDYRDPVRLVQALEMVGVL